MGDAEVHILPCLINFSGNVEFKRLFKDRIRSVPDRAEDDGKIPGGYELREVCGQATETVGFSVKVTEKYLKDVYYPLKGADPLLSGRFYVFFRGRQLRGSELALDALGFHTLFVSPEEGEPETEEDPEITYLNVTGSVTSLTWVPLTRRLWEVEQDVSPVSPNVAAYRYLALSRAVSRAHAQICDYEHEEEYFRRLKPAG